jgi:hypothetical protein
MTLENEFTQALWGTIEAAKEQNYTPTYFMQMLEELGGRDTARRLLAKREPQTGLYELWNLHILDQSMEAVICDNPRFHSLFTTAEIAEAHRRLEELDYFKDKTARRGTT